jgi:hypothetical protein
MRNLLKLLVTAGAVATLGAAPVQSPAVGSVMREKLQNTQKILEAVVTSNWTVLDVQTRALERLTEDPRWMVLKYPEYAKYSTAFKDALRDLRAAAVARDLDKTPQAYTTMTLKCVECHRYLARARIATDAGPARPTNGGSR